MQRVLVIQLRQLGDILLTTPMLRALKDQGAHVTFLCHSMGLKFFTNQEDLPYDRILTYREDDSFLNQYQLVKTLRSSHFDTVIDSMSNPKSAFYSLCTGSPHRVSWNTRRRWAFHKRVERQTGEYIVHEKNRLLEAAGFKPAVDISLFHPVAKFSKTTEHMLRHLNHRSDQIRIVISPASRKKERRWPEQQFIELANKLNKEWGAHIIWAWGPGEYEHALSLYKACPNTSLLPKMNIQELSTLLSESDFFIGPSNGPSHLAIAAKTPSLQLHGPTSAQAWNPPNSAYHQALQVGPMDPRQENLSDLKYEKVWAFCQSMKQEVDQHVMQRIKTFNRHEEHQNLARADFLAPPSQHDVFNRVD